MQESSLDIFSVRGKTALVTGGSRGIGYMIAEGLLRSGMSVYVCSRKKEELERATERLSGFGPCTSVVADLSSEDGIRAVSATIGDRPLHLLVNNAGASWGAPIADYTKAAFDRVINVNLTAPFLLTQALLPNLRAAANPDDPARIINISSVDGLRPPMFESYAYSSSKAALDMLTRHLANRFAKENITVNAIAPGLFLSKMTAFLFEGDDNQPTESFKIPLGRAGQMEDIAGATIFLASKAGAYLTGVVLPVAGGIATAD